MKDGWKYVYTTEYINVKHSEENLDHSGALLTGQSVSVPSNIPPDSSVL